MRAGLSGPQCALSPPPIYLLILQLWLVWPPGQQPIPNSPFPEPQGQGASRKELDPGGKSGVKLALCHLSSREPDCASAESQEQDTPQMWFNPLWPDWPNLPSLSWTRDHPIPMATGRTFIQQTFPPLSIHW